jgi:hypothetical protein
MKPFVLSLAGVALVSLVALRADPKSAAWSEESQSAAKAATVTTLLNAQKLDAIAAREDPQTGRFAAALYYPGVQLLVVSAVHPQPDLIEQRIVARKYRDAYLDLQGPATEKGRFFVLDLKADGLKRTRGDAAFDQTYINGTDRISYDGDWTSQKMSRSKYDQRFKRDDERYVQMLTAFERELAHSGGTAR